LLLQLASCPALAFLVLMQRSAWCWAICIVGKGAREWRRWQGRGGSRKVCRLGSHGTGCCQPVTVSGQTVKAPKVRVTFSSF
jgi:hypothetical protein